MPVIIDSWSESNQDGEWPLYVVSESDFAQSFTGKGDVLNSTKLYLRRSGSPTGNVYSKIYAHTGDFGTTGTPTGSAIAISDAIDVSTLSTSYELVTFTFSGVNKINIENLTNYCVSTSYGSGNSSNKIYTGATAGSGTADGNGAYLVLPTWYTDLGSGYDMCFYVYGDIDPDVSTTVNTQVVTSSIPSPAITEGTGVSTTVTTQVVTSSLPSPSITEGTGVATTVSEQVVTSSISTAGVLTTKFSVNYTKGTINSTGYTPGTINSTGFTPGTINSTDWTKS